MTTKFEVGDLVWAKMRFCTAWPAKVVDHPLGPIKKNSYYVWFYGSENFAWVKNKNISSYVSGYEIKRNFRSAVYRKAVHQIAEDFHEQQLENGYDFIMTQKPKRTLKEQEERRRKIQKRLKVRLFNKKRRGNKKRSIKKGKNVNVIEAAAGSYSSIPSTIKVHDFKKYFIKEVSVRLQRIDVRTSLPLLIKGSNESECACVEDQPPTLLPEL